MARPRKMRPRYVYWIEVHVVDNIAASVTMTTAEYGKAMRAIMQAWATGEAPDLADPDIAALWATVRAKRRLNVRSTISAAVRAFVLKRDGRVCRYCGAEAGPFEIDHIKPVARGGSDAPENLGVACKPCNLSKGAKLIEEWRP